MRWLPLLLLVASVAEAGPPQALARDQLEFRVKEGGVKANHGGDDPQYDKWADDVKVPSEDCVVGLAEDNYYHEISPQKPTLAVSSDGKAAWLSSDYERDQGCRDGIPGEKCPTQDYLRATLLVDFGVKGLASRPVASHVGILIDDKELAKVNEGPSYVEPKVDPGAEGVAKLFTSTIGDPAALAKTVSPRADTLLLGSARRDRYVGGAKVAAAIKQWKLGFKADDVRAGLTTSKTVAYVAANVIALGGKSKPTPYLALFIYEKAGKTWALVQAHFSYSFYAKS